MVVNINILMVNYYNNVRKGDNYSIANELYKNQKCFTHFVTHIV